MGKNENSTSDFSDNPILGKFQRIQDLVFITLRDEIFSGKLKPNEKLNTNQLSNRLGVSRTPIREALNRLIAVGLAETIPHRGTYVKELSLEEVIELYYIRGALDGIAARLAVSNFTKDEIEHLKEYCDDMEKLSLIGDFKAFLDINYLFHEVIYKATQSPHLQKLLFHNYNQSEQYRKLGLELPGRYEQICGEHRNLSIALAEGDMERAEYWAREHHFNSARQIAKSIGREIII